MFCHSKLFEIRPKAQQITLYYLFISIGWALGTFLIWIIAPLVFSSYFEYYLVMIIALIIAIFLIKDEIKLQIQNIIDMKIRYLLLFFVLFIGLNIYSYNQWNVSLKWNTMMQSVYKQRNFFGTLSIGKNQTKHWEMYYLLNWTIIHGSQLSIKDNNITPTAYYSIDSWVGKLLTHFNKNINKSANIWVVGLWVGTVASYCKKWDNYTFYDINPWVIKVAKEFFTYLKNCSEIWGNITVKTWDARLLLNTESNKFDILIIDAFSDDAIPVHLITKEALKLYLDHLNPDWVLAFHITNTFLDLKPVIKGFKEEYLFTDIVVEDFKFNPELEKSDSTWVLLSKNNKAFVDIIFANQKHLDDWTKSVYWTDQFNNILSLIK